MPRSRAFCSTVSVCMPVSNRIRCPSASTSTEKPHSPIPRSASMVDRVVILSDLTLCGGGWVGSAVAGPAQRPSPAIVQMKERSIVPPYGCRFPLQRDYQPQADVLQRVLDLTAEALAVVPRVYTEPDRADAVAQVGGELGGQEVASAQVALDDAGMEPVDLDLDPAQIALDVPALAQQPAPVGADRGGRAEEGLLARRGHLVAVHAGE